MTTPGLIAVTEILNNTGERRRILVGIAHIIAVREGPLGTHIELSPGPLTQALLVEESVEAIASAAWRHAPPPRDRGAA